MASCEAASTIKFRILCRSYLKTLKSLFKLKPGIQPKYGYGYNPNMDPPPSRLRLRKIIMKHPLLVVVHLRRLIRILLGQLNGPDFRTSAAPPIFEANRLG